MKKVMFVIAFLGLTASANAGEPVLVDIDQWVYSLRAPDDLSYVDKGNNTIEVTATTGLDCNQGIDELLVKEVTTNSGPGVQFKVIVGVLVRSNSAILCAQFAPTPTKVSQTVQLGDFIPFSGVVEKMVVF